MTAVGKRFRFMKVIAEGGFGKVYLAEMMSTDGFSRIVAVKVLHSKWSGHEEVVMRTRDEARLLGLIRHQNIVKVEDLTSIRGLCAIVMEYLEGLDMKCMAKYQNERGSAIPNTTIFEAMVAVTSALDAAYNGKPIQSDTPLQVIHRDIKPSNIFLTTNGNVKVLDFGTARANFAEREAKTMELSFGSQGYMAPERLLGEPDTPAADIFSLGITLYELLAREPFGRIVPRAAKLTAKVAERVDAMVLTGTDDWIATVKETLIAMLASEPSDRLTAAKLVDIFDDLAVGADGDGLRKFCRSVVTEAKAAEPLQDSEGDDFFGKTVPADVSGIFAQSSSGTPDAPLEQLSAEGSPLSNKTSSTTVAETTDYLIAQGQKSGMGKAIAGGGLLLVLAIGGFFVFGGDSAEPDAPEKTHPPAKVIAKKEAPKTIEASALSVSKDASAAGQSVRSLDVTLSVANGVNAKISIKNREQGYAAVWQAQGTVSLGDLPSGDYTTNVTIPGQSKIRKKSFTVMSGKTCVYEFSESARSWIGGCE